MANMLSSRSQLIVGLIMLLQLQKTHSIILMAIAGPYYKKNAYGQMLAIMIEIVMADMDYV